MIGPLFISVLSILAVVTAIGDQPPAAGATLSVSSQQSLLHLGSIDSFDITDGGVAAARELLAAIETGDSRHAFTARAAYAQLIPNENFGGEYGALAWFCDFLLTPVPERRNLLQDPFVRAFHDFYADDSYATLREYLGRKYHLSEYPDANTKAAQRWLGFLEDFILFNNPRREDWEKTKDFIDHLEIKPGAAIADIGSGPGYYTFKFSNLTGPKGRVYAIDINSLHNAFVHDYAKRNHIDNVEVINSRIDSIGLPKDSVDLAFSCSLYHIVYTTFSEPLRDRFIESIRSALKDDGRLLLVDNGPVADTTLPYHGPYITPDLIISQLQYYGFQLEKSYQIIPQRYLLVFKKGAAAQETPNAAETRNFSDYSLASAPGTGHPVFQLPVRTRKSLVHIPNDTMPDVTVGGRDAALWFYRALAEENREAAEKARRAYGELIPQEKFGDEYTAFAWFCDYLLADASQRQQMLQDPLTASYFKRLSANQYDALRHYLWSRYRLEKDDNGTLTLEKEQPDELQSVYGLLQGNGGSELKITAALRLAFLDKIGGVPPNLAEYSLEEMISWRDFILFNNPRRNSWEQTDRIIEAMQVRRGQAIADIGAGPGYYTFKFSNLVEAEGHVFAVDTNKRHLDYVSQLRDDNKVGNIETILSELDNVMLGEQSIDTAFLCSLYGVVYAASIEQVKNRFVSSIHKALKPGGRLVVVDNDIVNEPELPYHGPRIDPRLVIAQLTNCGFRLAGRHQFIPQRYVLIFEKVSEGATSSAPSPPAAPAGPK